MILATLVLSSLLAALIGYAFWVKIRVLWFKADLLDMLSELHAEAAKTHSLGDAAYAETRDVLLSFYDRTDYLTVPVILFALAMTTEEQLAKRKWLETQNAEFRASLDRVRGRFARRFFRYLFTESLTGLLLKGMVSAFPRSTIQKEADAAITASAETLHVLPGAV